MRASDSHGDFSEEFIADVLEAKREAELGLGTRTGWAWHSGSVLAFRRR